MIFQAFSHTMLYPPLLLLGIIFYKWCIFNFILLLYTDIFTFFLTVQASLIPYHDKVPNLSW